MLKTMLSLQQTRSPAMFLMLNFVLMNPLCSLADFRHFRISGVQIPGCIKDLTLIFPLQVASCLDEDALQSKNVKAMNPKTLQNFLQCVKDGFFDPG